MLTLLSYNLKSETWIAKIFLVAFSVNPIFGFKNRKYFFAKIGKFQKVFDFKFNILFNDRRNAICNIYQIAPASKAGLGAGAAGSSFKCPVSIPGVAYGARSSVRGRSFPAVNGHVFKFLKYFQTLPGKILKLFWIV